MAKKVHGNKLSALRMVAGQEKKYSKIIDTDGKLKEWVGIGWVDIKEADKVTAADRKKYPAVYW